MCLMFLYHFSSPAADCMVSWLVSVGVGPSQAPHYSQLLQQEQVGQAALPLLSLQQLQQLGVAAMGPRALIFAAAQEGEIPCCSKSTCWMPRSVWEFGLEVCVVAIGIIGILFLSYFHRHTVPIFCRLLFSKKKKYPVLHTRHAMYGISFIFQWRHMLI